MDKKGDQQLKELTYEEVEARLREFRDSSIQPRSLHFRKERVIFSDLARANQGVFGHAAWPGRGYFDGVELVGNNASLRVLKDIEFVRVSLSQCSLHHLKFIDCTFEDSTFEGARLSSVVFRGCSFPRSRFQKAILHDVNFSTSSEFPARILAGSDLTGAQLPEAVMKFGGLAFIADVSKHAQRVFTILLLICAYCGIVLGTVTDAELLSDNRALQLPVLQLGLSSSAFFLVAPIVVLAAYIYLQLYLQKLWDNVACLPAVFEDGRAVFDRADAWMVSSLVRRHFPPITDSATSFWTLTYFVAGTLAWAVAPITLLCIWFRYLRAQDIWVSLLHAALVALVAFAWRASHLDATNTLKNLGKLKRASFAGTLAIVARATPVPIATLAVLSMVSLAVFGGTRGSDLSIQSAVPSLLEDFGLKVFPDLQQAQVSREVNQHSPMSRQNLNPAEVLGPRFPRKRARYMDATDAFLASADFRGCDLTGACFVRADLRGARFDGAQLTGANFTGAWLDQTVFDGATMAEATLIGIHVYDPGVSDIDLDRVLKVRSVDLRKAMFGHELWSSEMNCSDIRGCDITTLGPICRSELSSRQVIWDLTTQINFRDCGDEQK